MKESQITARTYLLTWIGLVVFSGLTLALSFAPLGRMHVPIALIIAVAKTLLVALFFMHLAAQRSTQRLVIAVWLVLFVTLVLLVAADVGSRWVRVRPPMVEHSVRPVD